MRIRTRLVLVFLLLAVLPLTAIVLYSYASSLDAVQSAIQEETLALAGDMDDRMAMVRDELGASVARVSELPFSTALDSPSPEADSAEPSETIAAGMSPGPEFLGRLIEEMGAAAPLVESVEFIPAAPPAPATAPVAPVPLPPTPPVVPDAPALADESLVEVSVEAAAPSEAGDEVAIVSPVGPIIIRIPEALAQIDQMAELTERDKQAVAESIEGAVSAIEGAQFAFPSEEARRELEAGLTDELATNIEAVAEKRARAREAFHVQWKAAWLETRKKILEKQAERVETGAREHQHPEVRDFELPVFEDGEVVGQVRARVSSDEILRRILASTERSADEIPFAIDAGGKIHASQEDDRPTLESLPIDSLASLDDSRALVTDQWVIAATRDPDSGVVFGIARPIRDSIEAVRKTAARNFGIGMGLVIIALIGVIPLANHLTRDISLVTEGARKVANGDLGVEVPVRSNDEVGELAIAFNRMASDLGEQQRRLLEEERKRQQQEMQQRLLEVEYDRKTRELEDAREFQLSLLPKRLPDLPSYEIAVHMKTATEVGGDYYDFRVTDGGDLIAVIGDATGHGARAGTMVTVIKSLFAGWVDRGSLAEFLGDATETIRHMDLGRMAMALTLARFRESTMTVANAGMPPLLIHRAATGEVDEIVQQGMPLGTLAFPYEERTFDVGPGDTVLMMTDGFPELINALGEPLGYATVQADFHATATKAPAQIIASLAAAADAWSSEPHDDITFVVLRRRA